MYLAGDAFRFLHRDLIFVAQLSEQLLRDEHERGVELQKFLIEQNEKRNSITGERWQAGGNLSHGD